MHSLKKRPQFQKAYKKGRTYKEIGMMISTVENGLAYNRIGISVSTKKAPLSVKRNRIKRLIREAYRQSEHSLKAGRDIVFTVRADISGRRIGEIAEEMARLYKKSGMMN